MKNITFTTLLFCLVWAGANAGTPTKLLEIFNSRTWQDVLRSIPEGYILDSTYGPNHGLGFINNQTGSSITFEGPLFDNSDFSEFIGAELLEQSLDMKILKYRGKDAFTDRRVFDSLMREAGFMLSSIRIPHSLIYEKTDTDYYDYIRVTHRLDITQGKTGVMLHIDDEVPLFVMVSDKDYPGDYDSRRLQWGEDFLISAFVADSARAEKFLKMMGYYRSATVDSVQLYSTAPFGSENLFLTYNPDGGFAGTVGLMVEVLTGETGPGQWIYDLLQANGYEETTEINAKRKSGNKKSKTENAIRLLHKTRRDIVYEAVVKTMDILYEDSDEPYSDENRLQTGVYICLSLK